jgi:hypothetical protein
MAIQPRLNSHPGNTYKVFTPVRSPKIPKYLEKIPITTRIMKITAAFPSWRKKIGAKAIATKKGMKPGRINVI